jgi:hypothetical protein
LGGTASGDGDRGPGEHFNESRNALNIMVNFGTAERRKHERLETIENEIVLEWQEPTTTCSSEGKIVNISDGGALVVSDSLVELNGRVFLQMKTPVKTDRIGARVVRRGRNHELGMEFTDACPGDFRLAVTMGIDFKGLFGLPDHDRFSHTGD